MRLMNCRFPRDKNRGNVYEMVSQDLGSYRFRSLFVMELAGQSLSLSVSLSASPSTLDC